MFVATFLTFITIGGFPSFVEEMKVKSIFNREFAHISNTKEQKISGHLQLQFFARKIVHFNA